MAQLHCLKHQGILSDQEGHEFFEEGRGLLSISDDMWSWDASKGDCMWSSDQISIEAATLPAKRQNHESGPVQFPGKMCQTATPKPHKSPRRPNQKQSRGRHERGVPLRHFEEHPRTFSAQFFLKSGHVLTVFSRLARRTVAWFGQQKCQYLGWSQNLAPVHLLLVAHLFRCIEQNFVFFRPATVGKVHIS